MRPCLISQAESQRGKSTLDAALRWVEGRVNLRVGIASGVFSRERPQIVYQERRTHWGVLATVLAVEAELVQSNKEIECD